MAVAFANQIERYPDREDSRKRKAQRIIAALLEDVNAHAHLAGLQLTDKSWEPDWPYAEKTLSALSRWLEYDLVGAIEFGTSLLYGLALTKERVALAKQALPQISLTGFTTQYPTTWATLKEAGEVFGGIDAPAVIEPDEPSISDAEARAAIETLIRAKIKDVVAAGGGVMPSQDAPESRKERLGRLMEEEEGPAAPQRVQAAPKPKKAKRVKDEPATSSSPAAKMDRKALLAAALAEEDERNNPRRNRYMR
jgi:hypothetical protein